MPISICVNKLRNLAQQLTNVLNPVGHDVAGAVQLAAPAEIGNVLAQTGSLEIVSDTLIGKRLRELVNATC
jgi:hypothetical protein